MGPSRHPNAGDSMSHSLKNRVSPLVFVLGCRNLDIDGARRIRKEVLPAIKEGRGVVIDLKGVEFADSSGVGALAALASSGGRTVPVALVTCNRRLEQMLSRLPPSRLPPRYVTLIEGMDAVVSLTDGNRITNADSTPTIVSFPLTSTDAVIPNRRSSESAHVHGHVD